MDIDKAIEMCVLDNAVKYNGKASQGAVIGHLISLVPEIKDDMRIISKKIGAAIAMVNALSLEEQQRIIKEKFPELLLERRKERSDELKELDNVVPGKAVVMRFAPSPSGPMHIGHAVTGGLTSLYVKKYNGRFILRIEDTNSDNIDPICYEQLPKDGEWIFGNISETWVQSDRMAIYYSYAEKLIGLGAVYVCSCSQDQFKAFSNNMQECPCRNLGIIDQKKRWSMMFDKEHGYKEGGAVVRFKSDMRDKNPAMRDFPLIRINDSEHPRQGFKYRVWPLMNLCVTVDDIEAGMTHIIRAKDHADNAKRQLMMYKALGIANDFPETYFVGRYNFEGLEISCSKTREKINQGLFTGWDDIRIPFLLALRRRGYQPEAFMKYTRLVGISPVDKTVDAEDFFKMINSFNREILDPVANRHFLIRDPVLIKVKGAKNEFIKLDLHPDSHKGGRDFHTSEDFYIERKDYQLFKEGSLYRLMDCINFTMKDGAFFFHSEDYESYKGRGERIMHWLPSSHDLVKVEVLMPDATTVQCLGEPSLLNLKEGSIIQAERFGFMRLDKIREGVFFFWFAHS